MDTDIPPQTRGLISILKQDFQAFLREHEQNQGPALPSLPQADSGHANGLASLESTSPKTIPTRARSLVWTFHPSLQSPIQITHEDNDTVRRKRTLRKRKERRKLGPEDTARMQDACDILSLSENTIRNRMNPRSKYFDPAFPPIKPLGNESTRCAKGWRAGDLFAYRDSRRTAN